MRQGEEEEWTIVSTKGEVRTTEYVVSNLTPGVNYYFQVSAVNCAGQGEPIEMTEPVQAKDILGMYLLVWLCLFFFLMRVRLGNHSFSCFKIQNVCPFYVYRGTRD